MSNPFDAFDSPQVNAFDQFDSPDIANQPQKKQNTSLIGDIGTGLKRAVQQMPGMVTGLADIAATPIAAATGVNKPVSRAAEWLGQKTGFQPGKWAEDAAQEYSPEMQQAIAHVDQAKGFFPTLQAIAEKPRYAANVIAESAPSMIAGGVAGRAAMAGLVGGAERLAALRAGAATGDAVAEKALLKAGAIAGGIGEGAVTSGQQMSQTSDTVNPWRAAGSALAAGAGTGLIGSGAGSLANRLGITDLETALAAGRLGRGGEQAATTGWRLANKAKQIGLGALQEGVFQELPQSAQEQIWQNVAEGKPWAEGVDQAAAAGLVAGMAMGGGAAGFTRHGVNPFSKDAGDERQNDAQESPLLALPSPTYTGTPSDQILQQQIEQQRQIDAADANAKAIYDARAEYEAAQQALNAIRLTTDPAPIQQRIDSMLGVDRKTISEKERAAYEKAWNVAMAEQVGITHDANGREIPLTMSDYLNAIDSVAISRENAARAEITRQQRINPNLQQLADEESETPPAGPLTTAVAPQASIAQMPNVPQAPAQQTAPAPTQPPSGPLGKAVAKMPTLQTPAQPTTTRVLPNGQPVAMPIPSFTTPREGTTNATARHQAVEAEQTKAEGSQQQAAQPAVTPTQATTFDVSTRTDGQLQYLSTNGRPGWREAAAAELVRRQGANPADTAIPAAIQPAAPSIPAQVPNTPAPKAYPAGQARMLSASATRQGFPTEIYPHPTEPGKFALRVPGQQTEAPSTNPVANQGEISTPAPVPVSQVKRKAPPIMRRDDLVGAIMRITGGNGIAANMAETLIGEKANRTGNLRGLFTNQGQQDMDELATHLRESEGYDVRDGSHLQDMIREAAAGNVAVSMERASQEAEANAEKQHRAEINQRADSLGLKKIGGKRTLEIVESEIATVERERAEMEAQEERAAIEAEQLAYAANLYDESADLTEADLMRWLGDIIDYTQEDINEADSRTLETEDRRTETLAGGYSEGTPQGRDSERAETGETQEGTRGTGENFDLTGQTNREAAQDYAQEQQRQADEVKQPKENTPNVTADQVDLFNTQGGLFNSNREAPSTTADLPRVDTVSAPVASTEQAQPNLVDTAAHEAATSPQNDTPEPTEAQKEAGNYKVGRVKIAGLDISIENPEGSTRSGTDQNGKPWSITMQSHYGYLRKTEGRDGDHVDVFVKPGTAEDYAGRVFIIDQRKANGHFDEHKVMLGWPNEEDAKAAYLANYSKGWTGLGAITPMSMEQFKTWVDAGDQTQPIAPKTLPERVTAAKQKKQAENAERAAKLAAVMAKRKKEKAKPNANKASEQAQENGANSMTQEATAEQTKISDFGEKIGGARKDVWTSFKDAIGEISDDEVRNHPLSKSWPEPNYQSLIDNGADPWAVAFMRAARDEIPAKPRSSWKVGRWAEQVKLLRELTSKLISGEYNKDTVQSMMRSRQLAEIASRIELYELVGHEKSLSGISFAHRHYTLYRGKENVNLWVVEKETKATSFSNFPSELATADTKEELLARFKERYASLDSEKQKRNEVSFDLYAQGGKFFVGKKVGRNILELAGPFDTVKEAREHRNTHQSDLVSKLEKAKEIPKERRDTNNPRVGEDMRNGQDVTPQMFSEAFGFRGVEFGNWVEQTKRQSDLNDAYDALMDMAAILGVPPKAISLNGELGLAFGARGSGGVNPASAHYEPGKVVINLTKKSGAGSLGHEWWHALDNYFSRSRERGGDFMTTALDVSLSARESKYQNTTSVRNEMIDAFGRVVRAIKTTALKARSSKLDAKRTKVYWTTGEEMSARAFESYLISKLQDQNASNDYLANIVDQETWKAAESLGFELDDSYPYPTAGEMPAIREAFESFFDTVQTKETDNGTALYSKGAETAAPIPHAAAESRIKSLLGDKAGRTLLDSGLVTLVENEAALSNIQGAEQWSSETGGIQGATLPDGRIALVLSNLNEQNFDSIIKHEGFHAFVRQLVGEDTYKQMMDRIHTMMMRQESWAAEAWKMVPADTPAHQVTEEIAAYSINALANGDKLALPLRKWAHDFLSMLRTAIIRHLPAGKLKAWAVANLQPQDLERLAVAGLKAKAQGQLQQGREAVAYSKSKVFHDARSFIRSVINGKQTFKFYDFATVDTTEAARLKESTGLDLAGYKHTIDDMAIRHAIKQHGDMKKEIARGQIGINEDDLAMIPDIVKNYDSVERSADLSDGRPTIVYTKTYGNGETYYVEEFRRGREKLVSKTMWKIGPAVPRTTSSDGVAHTSETSGGQPDSTVANNEDESNQVIRYSKSSIIGDSGKNYTPEQRQLFKNVGRDVNRPTMLEKIKQWAGQNWIQGFVDQFDPIKALDTKAYALARLSKGATGAFEALMHHGKLSLTDGVYDADTSGGVLEKVFYPLGKETTDFLYWIAGNRAERLVAEGKENLFSATDIAAAKTLSQGTTDFDYTLPSGQVTRNRALIFQDSLRKFSAFNKNVMDMAEQSGLIDGASRSLWEHEFYVPFYRVTEDNDVRGAVVGKGLIRQNAFKKLKGGTDALNDLLGNTLMNWAHLIDASAKNRAAKATITAAENAKIAKRVAPDMASYATSNGTMLPPGTKGTVWYAENGKKKEYAIDDPHLLVALNGLDYAGLRGPMMDALSKTKHWLTMGVTASPFFKVRNLIRDSIQAIGTSDLSYNPVKNLAEGVKLTNKARQEYVSALAGGALIRFGTMLEGNESSRVRQLIKKGAKDEHILDGESKVRAFYDKYFEPWISAYNEIGNRGEEINRMALYDQLIKQGKSHAEAALLARDLLDFSMQGSFSSVRLLTQVVPFMNARLQGMYKLGRAAKEDPARFAIVTGTVALASLALLAAYHDDDDWKRREAWDRDNYWWFKLGGTAYRIPKPFEIGSIGTLAERTAEALFDDEMNGKRYRESIMKIVGDQLSMNPVPQLVKPIMDIYSNKDSFTGRPIESMSMERLDPEYRYNGSTSMVARGASQAIGGAMSPVQIDHLVRGYFSWLGATAVAAADWAVRLVSDEPSRPAQDYMKLWSGGMASDLDSAGSKYVSWMYDQAKEVEQAYGTYRQLLKEGRTDDAADYRENNQDRIGKYRMTEAIKKRVSTINQQIRMIERSAKDADTKREEINRLRKQQEKIAQRIAI